MRIITSLPLLALVTVAYGIRFNVPANNKKCMKEEIHKNIVVTGEYEFSEGIGYTGSVHVTDTRGHTLYKREKFSDLKGKFAFTADEYDIFEICISNHAPANVELRRLEDLSDQIVKDFAFMRQREEEMRNTNESTNSRVLYLSIFSMLCLLALAIWQVMFLRNYFKAKKLID
ncbi:Transmembrane emp24 domain-containing protein bai [Trichostrongylus colubriformis]|uniref:Transmembrane emp24 domain-containing protein bai n=1 Tax=Trichostrongylus colubriformis TaxID=6319 RepID=A0AAN8EZZ6_TRICO